MQRTESQKQATQQRRVRYVLDNASGIMQGATSRKYRRWVNAVVAMTREAVKENGLSSHSTLEGHRRAMRRLYCSRKWQRKAAR